MCTYSYTHTYIMRVGLRQTHYQAYDSPHKVKYEVTKWWQSLRPFDNTQISWTNACTLHVITRSPAAVLLNVDPGGTDPPLVKHNSSVKSANTRLISDQWNQRSQYLLRLSYGAEGLPLKFADEEFRSKTVNIFEKEGDALKLNIQTKDVSFLNIMRSIVQRWFHYILEINF